MGQEDLFPGMPGEDAVIGGKYRLIRKLSEGGGGIVWEAADPSARIVALKFLKWSPLKSRKVAAERFKNEFAILKSLAHPHISEIYDFGLDAASDQYYFTSELITCGDLKAVIGAPVPVLEELFLQALRALEYLRGHKLLHLDIKPQNLLLRQDGDHPILAMIDFGLAAFRAPDKPGGTANYMPPEMIVRRVGMEEEAVNYPLPDHRSDLYSLGVTFYYLLTGIQPFCVLSDDGRRIDALATLSRHMTHEPPPPSEIRPEVPTYLDRILLKMIARHPDDRFPSAIVVSQALQYSSPQAFAPESAATLLAYLPKEGRLVGRRREQATIGESIRAIAEGKPHAAPAICVAGGRGVGRSRLLASARPFAQQLEMEVSAIGIEELAGLLAKFDGPRAPAHLVVIDDLERALEDGTGLDALRSLARRLRLQQKLHSSPGQRILFLFAVDTDRMDVKRVLLELNLDDAICHSVELANFTAAEVAEYLATLLGEAPDASVVEQLARCTDGNPLFITEHLEAMIAKGRLFSLAGRPDAKTLKAIGVDFAGAPPSRSMAEAIEEKLRQLSPEAGAVALLLACFNRPVSVDELRAAGRPTSSHELLLLVSAGLVRRGSGNGRFAFVNDLAAKIIRTSVDPARRAQAHDAIARQLKRQRAKAAELDLHLAYGSDAKLRVPALARLADGAMENHEPHLAAEHLEALLALLPAADAPARAEALAKLGMAFERARRWEDAQAAYRRIRALKGRGPLAIEFKVRAAELTGLMAMRRRNLKLARRSFTAALAALKGTPKMLADRLRIENHLAGVDLRDGRFEEAVARFERTEVVAGKMLAKAEHAAVANNELGEALLRSGDPKQALPILKRELDRATRRKDEERQAKLSYLFGDALRHDAVRRFDEALARYRDGLKLARKHRLVELEVRLHNSLGNLNFKIGRPQQALEHYGEGLKLAQQIEGETTGVELMIGMGLAAQQMGKPDATIEYFEAALEFSGGPKGASAGLIRRFRPTILVSLGDAWYQKGDYARALEYLGEARGLDRKRAFTPDIRYSLYGTQVEIHLARGETDKAREHLPTLAAIAKAFPAAAPHLEGLKKRLAPQKEDNS